jgi:hypothetical protein
VRVFRHKFTLGDAIGSHACSLEAIRRVTKGLPLGCPLFLPVHTVNFVRTPEGANPNSTPNPNPYPNITLKAASAETISIKWSWMETVGFGAATSACVKELFTGKSYGVVTGGLSVTVQPHDLAVLRVVPGATTC